MKKEGEELCLLCEMNTGEQERKDCIPFQDYLTAGEEEALSKLRELKKESRRIRDRVRGLEEALTLQPENQDRLAFHKAQERLHRELGCSFQQLEELKKSWKQWEARRVEANQRKMVLLGYSP